MNYLFKNNKRLGRCKYKYIYLYKRLSKQMIRTAGKLKENDMILNAGLTCKSDTVNTVFTTTKM